MSIQQLLQQFRRRKNGLLLLKATTLWVMLPFLLSGFLDADPVDNSTIEVDNKFKATNEILDPKGVR